MDDAITFVYSQVNVCSHFKPQIHLLVILHYSLHGYDYFSIKNLEKSHLLRKHGRAMMTA
jgi:hypothetical protein